MAIMVGRSLSFSRGKHARFTSANAIIKGTLERSAALNANILSLGPTLVQQATIQFGDPAWCSGAVRSVTFPSGFTAGNTVVMANMGTVSLTPLDVPPMTFIGSGSAAGGGNQIGINYFKNLTPGQNYINFDWYWSAWCGVLWFGEYSGLLVASDIRDLGSPGGTNGGPQKVDNGTVSPYAKTSSASTINNPDLVVVAIGRMGAGAMSAASGWTHVADVDGAAGYLAGAAAHLGVYTQVVPSGTTPSISATGANAAWGLVMSGLKGV